MTAKPNDVLIVENMRERAEYRQFTERQVITLSRLDRLRGREVETIWLSDIAQGSAKPSDWGLIRAVADGRSAYVFPVSKWKPEPKSLGELIAELPEQNATSGRDFGRGYSKAVKDVLALIVRQADANGVAR